MGVFMYYLPQVQKAGRAELEKLGLADRFPVGEPMIHAPVLANGPDGGSGIIIAYDPPGRKHPIGYYPKRQKWLTTGGFYIGFDLNDRPDPSMLQKKTILAGHQVELGWGNWTIPCLRYFWPESGTPLPEIFTVDGNGKMIRVVSEKYTALCANADRLWYTFCQDFDLKDCLVNIDPIEPLSELERFETACQALAINYKITKQEILISGLISTLSLHEIEKALFDWISVVRMSDLAEEIQKKTAGSTPGSSDSGAGQEENCQATSPPGEK